MSIDLATERLTLSRCAELLQNGETTSEALCQACLDQYSKVDGEVNAFLFLDGEAVLTQAKAADQRRAAGQELSPYDGIPVAIKDNITVAGQTCSCASKILETVNSPYDATVIDRLKANGMILFGRANMDEFAMGSSCENSAFKKTTNPWDTKRVPGGSSGGSAAAVASAQAPVALGSDTGGSIRQPASFCGVVGLKPTYGRVSRYGLVAFASSLDQIGPLTNDVHSAAVMLDMIGGHDAKDSTSLPNACEGFGELVRKTGGDMTGIKLGLPKEYYELDGLDAGVKAAMDRVIADLKNAGAEIVEVSLPHTEYAIATYYIIATAEASANLARFDGIRYGSRSADAEDLMATYFKTRGEGFGDEVKRRIILGTYVLSSGYYDAYYLRAQKVRTLIRRDFEKAFESCDALLTPVSPIPAFRFGEKSDPLQMYLADIFTISVNLAGNCAISMPGGFEQETGMPVGVQFIAPPLAEDKLLTVARAFEQVRSEQSFVPTL